MYYGSIKPCDIANGTGVRVTLFVSGCTHRCKGCFQPQTWDFRYGQPFTAETEEALLEALDRPTSAGLPCWGASPSSRTTSAPCSPSSTACGSSSRTRPCGPFPATPGRS